MKSKVAFLVIVIIMLAWATISLVQQHSILTRIERQIKQTEKLNTTIDETLKPLTSGEIKL